MLIRWAIEKGFVVLPRSSKPGRIAENAQVFDFTLGPERMGTLDALDEGLTTGQDPAGGALDQRSGAGRSGRR